MPDHSPAGPGSRAPAAANAPGLKPPSPATAAVLRKELEGRPLLWVGAGASVAAGYPSTQAILAALARRADEPIGAGGAAPFPRVVDAFVASRGAGDLADILQSLFAPRSGDDHQPTPVHRAIARLAGAGCFHAIATTNYDDLLERALADAGVNHVLETLEDNAAVAGDGAVRLMKLHGSREDWRHTVLSGRSYEEFGRTYPFLGAQLDVLLRQRAVLFVGCSLQDPRLLDWLAAQSDATASGLKPWRALMTEAAWTAATTAVWDGGHASGALARGNVRPLLLRDHAQLAELLGQVASAEAPELRRLALELEVGAESGVWPARLAGCPGWQVRDPLADPALLGDLDTLREQDHRPLPTDERGQLTAAAAVAAAGLRALAASVGDRMTAALLSPAARAALAAAVRAGIGGEPHLLPLRVRTAAGGETAEMRADRALALPWELLRLDGRFPVEDGTLDLAREAVLAGVAGLKDPDQPLAIVACCAAPVDATDLDSELEMYRLWRALGRGADERRLLVTDLGTLDELAGTVERVHPPVVHWSGHGRPGVLLFEDEAALAHPVPVGELVRRLRDTGPLPRLLYLSTCHGATAGAGAGARGPAGGGQRMVDAALGREPTAPSTAASLHRAGLPQVVAYFGPVGDRQATRGAAAFYAALAGGSKARQALRRARRVSSTPHLDHGRPTHVYPLGWAQLALYHRGADVATALAIAAGGPPVDLEEDRRRDFEQLSRRGGSDRVEGIRGVQRLRFGFVGRRKERAEALRRWRREGERQLVVLGLGGLGKTALCTELAPLLARDLAPGGAAVLAFDGRHAGAQASPILALWQEVQAAHDGEAWSRRLAELQQHGITGDALAQAVIDLASIKGGLLVYLDDAESLQQPAAEVEHDGHSEHGALGHFRDAELRRFWELLRAAAQPRGSLGLLASSRYLPEGTPAEVALPLPPLRRFEVVRLLAWMPTLGRLAAEDRAWLAEETIDGHPRTVEYLEVLARQKERQLVPPGARYQGGRWRDEILAPVLPQTCEKVGADLLLGSVWAALPPDAQDHLGRCTVLTAPAPWEAVRALEPAEGTGAVLVDAGMLSPFQAPLGRPDWWAPHRLVSEEARKHWTGPPREAHRQLGRWYEQRYGKEQLQLWGERAVLHLTAAGDGDAAWPIARFVAIHLRDAGRYREALGWVERALAAAPSGAQLGIALAFEAQLGRFAGTIPADAEQRLLQALELVEPGKRSFVLDELGQLAQYQGQLQSAADYLQRSVQVETDQKGKIHRDVAATLHTLAGVLQAQGDLAGARRRFERALEIQSQVLGTDLHPDVAASLHELAGVLQTQGDLAGARRHLERALEIKAQVLGTELHPSVASSLHALAGVLQNQGDLAGARRHLERAIEINAQVLGTELHPSVAATLHALAGVLQAKDDLAGARHHLERALEIYAQVLSTELHPSVAASLHELAGVLRAQGDLAGARRHLERVLEIEGHVYGTREHYSTAITEMTLGALLLEQGEVRAARSLWEHAHAVFLAQLGAEHPYTRQAADLIGEAST
jgi:tetratricopeptide (TPR) repeat protein